MSSLSADLQFRGLIHQVTDTELLKQLDDRAVTLYSGFDPSAASLHVGHLMQLCTLRRFQLAGHRAIAVAGGTTGMIGDPGGKSGERSLLTPDQLAANLAGIEAQIARFLDLAPAAGAGPAPGALLLDNSEWLAPMTVVEFLRAVGKHFTVNQMVTKESVRARLERPEQGISYTEFSYMLLQAYDFLRLREEHGCELQIGGSDQWGNITMGVELIRKVLGVAAYGLTTPLVTKADGTKFGKTEAGTVWLDPALTSPYRLFQFFLNTEDTVVGSYLRYFTFLAHDEITALDAETAEHPQRRTAQRALAREVCRLVHGSEEAARAEEAAGALFGGDLQGLDERTLLELVEEAPATALGRDRLEAPDGLGLVDLLAETGLASSKADARRSLAQGGVYLNNGRVDDVEAAVGPSDLLHGRYLVLRRGKRTHHLVRFE